MLFWVLHYVPRNVYRVESGKITSINFSFSDEFKLGLFNSDRHFWKLHKREMALCLVKLIFL